MRSHNRQGKPNIFFNRKTASYLRWMFTLSFVGLAFRFQSSHYLGYWKYCCKRLGVLHYCGTWNQIRVLHVILLHSFSDKTANKKCFLQCSLYFNFRNHLKQRMNDEIMSTFYLVKHFPQEENWPTNPSFGYRDVCGRPLETHKSENRYHKWP